MINDAELSRLISKTNDDNYRKLVAVAIKHPSLLMSAVNEVEKEQKLRSATRIKCNIMVPKQLRT